MKIKIKPSELSGTITAPASKSEAHRILICAALADGSVKIYFNSSLNDDINATIECLSALGAEFKFNDNIINVTPINKDKFNKNKITERPVLNCHESGSTLRFMLPVAAALCENILFTGTGRLPERPVNDLLDVMSEHGVNFNNNKLPFETEGKLKSGEFFITGGVSSQYITGLLLALPLLGDFNAKIILTSDLKSADYVNITLSVLKKFGININFNKNIYELNLNSKFKAPEEIKVGGDWSGAAFFLAAGALNAPVSVTELDINSAQGDKKILEYLEKFGAKIDIDINQNKITVSPRELKAQDIDIDATPDLMPILAVLAAFAKGKSRFYNGSRLRLKESDRIKSTADMINSLGFFAEELPDGLIIQGSHEFLERKFKVPPARGEVPTGTGGCSSEIAAKLVNSFNDHRIVMAAAIAAANCEDEVIISDYEAINKSYPDFFNDYKNLGGKAVFQTC